MKVTVDTNFLISATQWDYSVSHRLLLRLIEKDVKIYTTSEILNEFTEVLKRDFKYNADEIIAIIGKMFSFVTLIIPKKQVNIIKNDPDDNKVIECALESNSKYIITYDKHLLNLKKYKAIDIITPEKFSDKVNNYLR